MSWKVTLSNGTCSRVAALERSNQFSLVFRIDGVQVTLPSPCWMTLTKDFACLQCKYHSTLRKSICPLDTMGVVVQSPITSTQKLSETPINKIYCRNYNNRQIVLGCTLMAFVFWQIYFIEVATLLTPHWTLLVLVTVVQPYIHMWNTWITKRN